MTTTIRGERDSDAQPSATIAGVEPKEHYEIVNGLIVEEPPLGAREGWIATTISFLLNQFIWGKRLGRVANEVLFILQTTPRLRRSPDVAFVSSERWSFGTPVTSSAAWDVVPDIAVEVISPSDLSSDVQTKIAEYFRAGVRLVWVVYPRQAEIYVYESPRNVRVVGREGSVDGGSVLPGFKMALIEVFETDADEPLAEGDE